MIYEIWLNDDYIATDGEEAKACREFWNVS